MAIIDKPTDHFTPTIYTGTGSTQSITSLDFAPDLVWLKNRTTAYNHGLWDSIRGATNALYSSATNAEGVESGVSAFNSNGFSVGSSLAYNKSSDLFISWNWKAGGTAVSNTAGSITSSVSANTTAGFSVATFTTSGGGIDTVGHSLGVAPSMIILKSTTNVNNWSIYHKSLGNNKEILFTTGASSTNTIWNNTTPTSTVWSLNTANFGTGRGAVAYCFANTSMIKCGSYTGNGSTDGTFVYTGMKPAFILVKNTQTGVNSWEIHDNKRDTYNVGTKRLYPNASASEGSGTYVDMLSNGFKWRSTDGGHNSAHTFIYLAIAENPLVTSTGIPATAK